MGELNVLHIYNGIFLGLKTEGNSDPCYITDKSRGDYVNEISHLQKDKYYLIHLHEVSRIVRFMEIENKTVVSKGLGR